MSRWNALKKTCRMCTRLRAQRGGSRMGYLLDALWCSVRHGASPENYFVLRFFDLPDWQRATFLTSGRSGALDRALNRNAAAAEKEALANKARFLTVFAPDVRRTHVYAPEADFAAFCAFLDGNDTFFLKPVGGTMGRGIERCRSAAVSDRAAFYDDCRAQRLLLEAPIRQHPALEALSPGCVNSVRVNAARGHDGRVRLIGACLKCGGKGAATDNFHTGGIAYPLELTSGRVSGPGRNNTDLGDYARHPASGAYLPGFQVPFWPALTACVYRAMDRVPGMGYVGWDIAVTPDGPELIEGNWHWPGGNIIQFDGVGKYPLLRDCAGETDEKHPH